MDERLAIGALALAVIVAFIAIMAGLRFLRTEERD